ncbi:MAG: hypothetical protein IT431_05145 [Phycisphaerales bacterium]|nr:hypothetical protein [Phycisphaerales bacterium]
MKPQTPTQFVQAWKGRHLTERASSQTHFRPLCGMLGIPAPSDNRTQHDAYCFDAITATAGSKVYAAASKGRKGAKARQSDGPGPFGHEDPEAALGAEDGLPPLSRTVSAPSDSRGVVDVWERVCCC